MPDSIKAIENWDRRAEELGRNATMARFYRLLMLGMFSRMFKAEIETGGDGLLKKVLEEVEAEMEQRAEDLERVELFCDTR